MLDGVADNLGRLVEAHRLAVEQGRAEDLGVMALQPGRGVGQEGKAGGVAFREAVGAEALQLGEGLFGELDRIAALDHAADQLVLEVADPARELEGGHGPAQLVRLAGREAGALDRHPHGLFLEERRAQGLSQHLLQLRLGEGHRLLALAAAKIGMDHVALDRARPYDRHLDHQVVERPRLQARQHGHLRPALDLEDAQRVGPPDHGVGARVFRGDAGQVERNPLGVLQEVQSALQAGHHPQPQHVDLHELQLVDVVLVPFDDLAVFHPRRLDRPQFVESVLGQHEAAGVLGEMTRGVEQELRQLQGQA